MSDPSAATPNLYKVALTGAQGTGKSWMIARIAHQLRVEHVEPLVITSPTRSIMRLGNFTNNKNTSFELQMMLMAERAKLQMEAQFRVAAHSSTPVVILADRCNLDELAYTEERVASSALDSQYVTNVAHLFEDAPTQAMRTFIPLATRFCFGACEEFWDAVYYKPPHPDHPPEGEGERSGDRAYQLSVDTFIRKNHTFLANRGRVQTYHARPDREEAVEQIVGNILAHFGKGNILAHNDESTSADGRGLGQGAEGAESKAR